MVAPIADIRRRRGLSQDRLAEMLRGGGWADASQKTLSLVERGLRALRDHEIVIAARVLDVPPAALLPSGEDGLAEADAAYEAPPNGDRILAVLAPGRPGAQWIRARSDALALRGYMPGDFLIYEPAAQYRDGDRLVVNYADPDSGPETLLRELDGRFLRPASLGRHRIVEWDPDDQRLAIMGRVIYRVGNGDDGARARECDAPRAA